MRILKASKKDLEQITEIHDQFSKIRLEQGLGIANYYKTHWIEEEIENGNFYVLKKMPMVYAAMSFYLEVHRAKTQAYIMTLAVREDKHKRGLGRRLVEFAKKKAKKEGKKKLIVDSLFIYDTKDFYLNCGFKIDKELEDMDNNPFYRFSMRL